MPHGNTLRKVLYPVEGNSIVLIGDISLAGSGDTVACDHPREVMPLRDALSFGHTLERAVSAFSWFCYNWLDR
jgi:hypothetical protein